MSLARDLDELPAQELSPGARLLQALEMYEEGIAMQRLSIRRRFPGMSEADMDAALQRWLKRADEAR